MRRTFLPQQRTLARKLALAIGVATACSRSGGLGRPAAEDNPVVAQVGQRPIFVADVEALRAEQRLFAGLAAREPTCGDPSPSPPANARLPAPRFGPAPNEGVQQDGVATTSVSDGANVGQGGSAPDAATVRPGTGADAEAGEWALRRAALQQLVEEALLAQAAEAAHVAVLADEIDAAWGAASRAWPEGALQEALRQARTSVPQMKARLRDRLLAGKVLRAEALARVLVRDEDIDAYLAAHPELHAAEEAVRLRQIVLPDEERVQEAQQALKRHAAFADVAARLSVGAEASAGGELGALTQSELPRELAAVAFALRPRQVSRPVRAADGWHLFCLEERLSARPRPKAELRLLAERRLRAEREVAAAADYLARLAQAAHVQVHEQRLSRKVG